jgi:hypothetical protein
MAKSSKAPRIMYIESKAAGLNGPARIGRVTFSKTGLSIYYKGKTFLRIQGFKRIIKMRKRMMSIGFPGRIAMEGIACTSATSQLRLMRMCEKSIGQQFGKSLSSRTGFRPERISNR